MMTEKTEEFKQLFSDYCRERVNACICGADECEFCPVNAAYEMIFPHTDPEDEEDECSDEENVVDATYTSVWDGGFAIETACKVNMDTREVFDIEPSNNPDVDETVETLEREFITLSDGQEFDVCILENRESDTDFYRIS